MRIRTLINVAPMDGYENRKNRLVTQLCRRDTQALRLGKDTSNLFRERREARGAVVNVRDLCNVLHVDVDAQSVDVEGMTTYARLVDATLKHGCMPAVVPQLKSITIGGAVAGVGIESSSFRYGLPHETVHEMEILLSHGEVVTCTPDNEHRDLYFGIPNSYGTLGYILRLKAMTVPVKPFVKLTHMAIEGTEEYFAELERHCASSADFVDGVVFGPTEHYLTIGHFVDEAPYTSDYTFLDIYYRSIRERDEDYLTVLDYIWRWDTDWFWCSKNLYAQNAFVRRLLGPKRLNSTFYTKVMRWNSRWGVMRSLNRLTGNRPETVIQDVDIPIENAPAFLEFFREEIGIQPVWICPFRHYKTGTNYPLYPVDQSKLYVNFGFWDVIPNRRKLPGGHFNRLIEEKVKQLSGIKSLYSDAYFEEAEFWRIYNGDRYRELKARYDPQGRLKNLYEKCVLRG